MTEQPCKNCGAPIVFATYREVGSYEPDYDPADDKQAWRHVSDGYATCWQRGKFAEPFSLKVYVASSWRCVQQPVVVKALWNNGIECYDFRYPIHGSDGFHWSDVMPSYTRGNPLNELCPPKEYLAALEHPIALEGFKNDFDAMKEASHCVLVLPCGRSAHLEAGWFIGQGRPTAILIEQDAVVPELMYKMADLVTTDLSMVVSWLKLAKEAMK